MNEDPVNAESFVLDKGSPDSLDQTAVASTTESVPDIVLIRAVTGKYEELRTIAVKAHLDMLPVTFEPLKFGLTLAPIGIPDRVSVMSDRTGLDMRSLNFLTADSYDWCKLESVFLAWRTASANGTSWSFTMDSYMAQVQHDVHFACIFKSCVSMPSSLVYFGIGSRS